jgi:Mrp family chromosome partitioning ATPase/DUF971 family protein
MTDGKKTEQVLNALRVVIDPDLGKDIVTLGFVKQLDIADGRVSFVLELTTPACPIKDRFRDLCTEALQKLPWVREVKVEMGARKRRPREAQGETGLRGVKRIIGVSSCKGGVGKSTVAVNLAFALSKTGAAVGLLDADVYGPSLPTLVRLEDTGLKASGGMIMPKRFEGVELMSFGYAADASKAAIMRGPMVSNVISQLALNTDWGELDYLVVDMPPGTGDIQLTLTQKIAFSGAVIVTTPQSLSFADVIKGMQMFETVKVPTLAVVENMSYFVCDKCSEKHHPFGQGALARLVDQYGIRTAFEVPMQKAVSDTCDRGRPLVLEMPDSDLAGTYRDLAGAVVREIERIENGAIVAPSVTYDEQKGIVVRIPGDDERVIHPADLRRRCQCAGCRDEHTGEAILKPEDVPDDVYPVGIEPMGNYAVAVRWSDGHESSIYPYDKL